MNLPHLAQRLFNVPLAIHPRKAEVVMAALTDRFGITQIHAGMDWDDDDEYFSRKAKPDTGYDVLEDINSINKRVLHVLMFLVT